MTPRLLIKLATKQPEVYVPPRVVPPLAQVKAQQLNVPLPWLCHGSMLDVMNFLTRNLKNGTIATSDKTASIKQANQESDCTGAVNDFAQQHVIAPQNDNKYKWVKALFSPYIQGYGYRGACDAMALARSIVDPNVIKGMGENVLSLNKFKNIFSSTTIGSLGRNGGTRPS